MTERERWIVYPLLFLALGAALRDKLKDRTISKSIWCEELIVVDEQPATNRSSRVLARIGRTNAVAGALPRGHLMVNGEVEIVDDLARGPRSAPVVLARISPKTATRGVTPGALLSISGEVHVYGLVNAGQYAYQGMIIAPALQGVVPGVSWPDFIRALQQSMQNQQQNVTPRAAPPQPPANEPAPQDEPAAGENGASLDSRRGEQASQADRLADPAESQ